MQILTDASPSDNYGWYQGQFFDQVEKVYALTFCSVFRQTAL